MVVAYSRLKSVLGERNLTVPELHRRIKKHGININLKSLYRLVHDQEPLERLDLRVAGAVCEVCQVPLSELITFTFGRAKLQRLPATKQQRLDVLMTKNNDGKLSRTEQNELRELVREAEEITLANARVLARQRAKFAGAK